MEIYESLVLGSGIPPHQLPVFLASEAWRAVREDAIALNGGRCECCKRRFTSDHPLNVDHVRPRKFYPHLALDKRNLQCLCGSSDGCNAIKGNTYADYRSKWHPYRITWWRRLYLWIKQLRKAKP